MFHQRRSLLLTAATLAGAAWAPPLRAQGRELNEAINKAGRQRMLSQRMAKCWLALGQNVRREQAEKVLAESMALFERQLTELKTFAPRPEVRTTYEALDAAWRAYKTALVGTAQAKAGADAVMSKAQQVLGLAHQGTTQLEALSGKPVGKLVNMAGRQRMLSQRMAAMYLSASWGVQTETAVKALATARDEFTRAHQTLDTAPEATADIHAGLALARNQFIFFEQALSTLRPGSADPRLQAEVFTTSERILQVMEDVTGQFALVVG